MSKKFTEEQDYLLALSYKDMSLDAATGTEQPMSVLWNRIHKDYLRRCKDAFKGDVELYKAAIDWEEKSLRNRFDRFHKTAVPHYKDAVAKTTPRSGESHDDLQMRQLLMYGKLRNDKAATDKPDKYLRSVRYLPRVAEVLGTMAQFGGDHGNVNHHDREVNASVLTAFDTPLPIGCKAAKKKKFDEIDSGKKKEAMEDTKLAAFSALQKTIAEVAAATTAMAASVRVNQETKRNDYLLKLASEMDRQGDKVKAKEMIAVMYARAHAELTGTDPDPTINMSVMETSPPINNTNTVFLLDGNSDSGDDAVDDTDEDKSVQNRDARYNVAPKPVEVQEVATESEEVGDDEPDELGNDVGGGEIEPDKGGGADDDCSTSTTDSEIYADITRVLKLGTKESDVRKRLAEESQREEQAAKARKRTRLPVPKVTRVTRGKVKGTINKTSGTHQV